VADLGFVAGAEAGLVLSVTDLASREGGTLPQSFSALEGGIAAADLVLVIGGVDIGPRTWVEQVATRLPELPLVAIVPTFMQPEVAPYLRSGQLQGLVATVRDAASVAGADTGAPPLGLLAGMLLALALVVRALAAIRPGGDASSDHPGEAG
jgi:peptidoglycan/LPS O-acetylase OafA/YrhL